MFRGSFNRRQNLKCTPVLIVGITRATEIGPDQGGHQGRRVSIQTNYFIAVEIPTHEHTFVVLVFVCFCFCFCFLFFFLENITCTVASLLLLLAKIAQKGFPRLLVANSSSFSRLGSFSRSADPLEVLRNGEVVRERRG